MKYYNQQESYLLAKKEVKKIKSFYIHLAIYLILNIYMIVHFYIYEGFHGMQGRVLGSVVFWGVGLFFHWYGAFGNNLLFSKQWKKRKIKELMDQY